MKTRTKSMACPQKMWPDWIEKAWTIAGTTLVFAFLLSGDATSGANLLTDGLVAHYPLNGNTNDASGNANHATVRGRGLTLTTDRFGNPNAAYHFDFSSYIVAPRSASLEPRSGLTVSAWVKPETLALFWGENVVLCKRFDASSAPWNSYLLNLGKAGHPMFCLSTLGDQTCIESAALLSTNDWSHLAGTYDGTVMQLFVNGRLVASGQKSGPVDYGPFGLMIGATPQGSEHFLGNIGEVRVYSRALAVSEIQQLCTLKAVPPAVTASAKKPVASLEPASAEESLAHARKLRQEGKLDEACEAFEKAVQLAPRNEESLMEQFTLLAEMNVPADALKVLDKLITLKPDDPQRWGRKAMVAAEAGRIEEAFKASDGWTQLQPGEVGGWLLKAQCLTAIKRSEEALQAVDKAITMDPMNDDAWRTRIAVEPNLKNYDGSFAFVSKLVGQYPQCLGAVYDRAGLYAMKGDKAKALADLKIAVALRPADVKPYARQDERFKSLWNDPDFKKLTE